jgi:hypothetical protein
VIRRPFHKSVVVVAAFFFATFAGSGFAGGGPGQQPPSSVSAPTISGTAMAGQTLSASTGSWKGVSLSYAYQWKRCDLSGAGCNPIGGATAATYQLGTADVGTTLRVDVTASNKNGAATATSGQTAVVAPAPAPAPPPAAPTNTALPQITGTAQVGQTLTSSTGTWSGSPTSYGYQWQRCGSSCAAISGATGSSYALTTTDAASTIRVAVTATNSGGSTTATSAATTAVASAPTTTTAPSNTALPQLSGTAQAGQTMKTSTGTWSGSPTSYGYQWKRCDSAGANCAAISGATASSYVVASGDVGSTLRATVSATNTSGTGTATSAQSATAASAPTSTPSSGRFGFAAGGGIQNLSSTDLARYLDGVKAAHASWIRIDINWSVVQSGGPAYYNWTAFDAVVNAARSRGLNVLGTIIYTPSWARASGTSGVTPPTNLSDYANFAKAAATHFGLLGVHAYEIWNEPNIVQFWAPGPDPARYTQMLKLAYAAVKQADSSATVISAGLSPYGSYGQSDAQHMNPISFLEKMYANGAAGNMDAVGWHPYNYPYGIGFYNWSAWSQMSQTAPSARSVMSANGDGAKQIWATEFGAPTGSTSNSMSMTAQAQLVTDSYAALKGWSWAGPAFFYSYRDNGTNLSNVEDNFGVLYNNWSPKPAYTAYQAAAAAG